MITTSQRIYEILSKLKITYKEFADEIGVSKSIVCRWIKGERKPSFKHSYLIVDFARSRGMDINLEWLRPY